MRKLSSMLGVSRTALYHHFGNKHELLAAVAIQSFEELEQKIYTLLEQKSRSEKEDAHQLLKSVLRAYVEYAIENPARYELMFGQELWKTSPAPELQRVAWRSFLQFVHQFEELQQHTQLPRNDDAFRMAQVTWATLHGLSRLLTDGVFASRSDLQPILDYAVNVLLLK